MEFLSALPYRVFNDGDCAPGRYYMVNNDLPAYTTTGGQTPASACPAGIPCIVPPSSVPTIGEELSAHNISLQILWRRITSFANNPAPAGSERIALLMLGQRIPVAPSRNHDDITERQYRGYRTLLYRCAQNNTLPAVFLCRLPDSLIDAHPGYLDPTPRGSVYPQDRECSSG